MPQVDFRNIREPASPHRERVLKVLGEIRDNPGGSRAESLTVDAWAVNRHQFSAGKIHALKSDEQNRAFCGLRIESAPGQRIPASSWDGITCNACKSAKLRKEERDRDQQIWERERAEREAEQQRENIEWWNYYTNVYMRTVYWRVEVHDYIFKRDGGLCRVCVKRPATQVHHDNYNAYNYCRLNGLAWRENMDALKAVCGDCHEFLHRVKEYARGR